MKRLTVATLIITALISATSAQAATLYIQSQKAYLLEAPKFSAEKISALSKGSAVQSLQTKGSWHQVSTESNQVGWVSKLLLKPHPPLERVSVLVNTGDDFKENVRRRSSSIVTAGAARGLASEERSRVHQQNEANYFALKKVESLNIDEAELDRFSHSLEAGNQQ